MKRIVCIALIISIFSTANIFADIDSFVDSVDNSRTTSTRKHEKKITTTSKSSSSSSSCGDSCGDAFFNFAGVLWLANNLIVTFNPYPYSNEGKYLNFTDLYSKSSMRYSIATSAVYMKDIGFGNESCFEGYFFKFFGPLFENTIYFDNEVITGNVKLGGQLALIQTNPFSLSCFCQWTSWYGEMNRSIKNNGCAIGFNVRSYPFRPFILEWQVCDQLFGENKSSFLESEVRLGVIVNRIEFFGEWKYFAVISSSTKETQTQYNGFTLGTRLYF